MTSRAICRLVDAQDVANFKALTDELVKEYDAYEVLPGAHVKGEFTLGENVGDLAGMQTAYDAYHASLDGKEAPVIDGMTGDQRFYLGWAQVWRRNYREANLRAALADRSAFASIQRTWIVRNFDPWYRRSTSARPEALSRACGSRPHLVRCHDARCCTRTCPRSNPVRSTGGRAGLCRR